MFEQDRTGVILKLVHFREAMQLDASHVTCELVQNKGQCIDFFPKNSRLLWKWVGGSRSHLEFFLENHPKIVINQYRYLKVVYHMYSVCIYIVKSC